MNKCLFTGRLTKGVNINTLKNEKKTKVAYYTIAVQDDFDYKKANFINCQTFGKSADYLEKYGKKGIYIEFEGKTSTYKTGDTFNTVFVSNAVKLIFANSNKKDNNNDDKAAAVNNDDADNDDEKPLF